MSDLDPLVAALAAHCQTTGTDAGVIAQACGVDRAQVVDVFAGTTSPTLLQLRRMYFAADMVLDPAPVGGSAIDLYAEMVNAAAALELNALRASGRGGNEFERAATRALAGLDAIARCPQACAAVVDLAARAHFDACKVLPGAVPA